MNILVLGGTGAMGRHLVDLLAKDGHKLTVTSRRERLGSGNISYVKGNAKDWDFLHPLLLSEKWDAVIDFMVYVPQEFAQRAELFLNSAKQYIFLSSARVYADSPTPITENSPRLLDITNDKRFLADEKYALAKAREENILFASKNKNWTIIRPYITYDEQRLQLGVLEKEIWLYRALNGKEILFSKDIAEKITTLTYGKDVAEAMAKLTGNPKALGEIFHITTEETIRWSEVLDIYTEVLSNELGREVKPRLLEKALNLAAKRAKYQVLYDRYYDRIFNNDKIKAACPGIKFTPVREGLKNALEQFLKTPAFVTDNLWLNAREDDFMGETTPLQEITGFKSKIRYILLRYFLGKRYSRAKRLYLLILPQTLRAGLINKSFS